MKGVYFTKIKVKGSRNLYNLAFGDKNMETGEIDDKVITNNQDREKVLATIVNTIIIFTKRHPKAQIYFEGSSLSRIRLYQIAINKYYDEFSEIFVINGYTSNRWIAFEKGINYEAFILTRK